MQPILNGTYQRKPEQLSSSDLKAGIFTKNQTKSDLPLDNSFDYISKVYNEDY